jgi:hypothetical protein
LTITTSPMHDRGPGWRCSCGLGVCGGGFCAAGTWRARQRAPAMCRTTPRPPPRSTLTSASGRCRHHTPPLTHERRCARLAALMQLGVCGSGSATPHAQSTPPKSSAMCYITLRPPRTALARPWALPPVHSSTRPPHDRARGWRRSCSWGCAGAALTHLGGSLNKIRARIRGLRSQVTPRRTRLPSRHRLFSY